MPSDESPFSGSAASVKKRLPGSIVLALLIPPIVALLILPAPPLLFGGILAEWASVQSSAAFFAAKPLSPRAPPALVGAVIANPDATHNEHTYMAAASGPKWAQNTVTLPPQRRGCHLITSKIIKEIAQDLSEFKCGLAHLFLCHTSASLTINENYDSDVRDDTETFLNKIVPEGRSAPWKHTLEGPDDMPAHIKSSMFGCSLTIPITDGKLNMGTWQGIWLCEHRDAASARTLVVTMNGI